MNFRQSIKEGWSGVANKERLFTAGTIENELAVVYSLSHLLDMAVKGEGRIVGCTAFNEDSIQRGQRMF